MRKNQPSKKFKVGRINVTIWRNEGEKGPYHSITFDRRFKGEDGEWRTVTGFSTEDLPDLMAAAEMAKTYAQLRRRIEEAEEE